MKRLGLKRLSRFLLGENMEKNVIKTKTRKGKLVRLGQEALVVVLPKEFVTKAGLRKGDTIGITYDSLLVIINPNPPVEEK